MVTGPNGSGKSSLVEGVAWGGWGVTLRGTKPWRALPMGVCLGLAGLTVTRTRSEKDKNALTWNPSDQYGESELARAIDTLVRLGAISGTDYDTPTKAQEALDKILGPFDVWRRCNVFSAQDGAHFTLASDGERKRLIESFLGADIFDSALEECRADIRATTNAVLSLRGQLSAARADLSGAQNILAATETALSLMGPEPDRVDYDPMAFTRVSEMAAKTSSESRLLEQQLRELERQAGAHEAEAKHVDAQLKALGGVATCSVCTQPVSDDLRETLRAKATAAREAAQVVHTANDETRAELSSEIAELREEYDTLTTRLAGLRRKKNEAITAAGARDRWAQQLEHHERVIQGCRAKIEELTLSTSQFDPAMKLAVVNLLELTATERVLGLRGVRAPLLTDSLAGIEAVANSWLARLGRAGLEVGLKPYSEKKSGGVVDAISLDVAGAGGGYGYKASSGGERRRIDVALMLALAEVACAAHGHYQGTMFFDEVFDQLDVEGLDSLAEALGELAEDRCVVVITHSEALVDRVPWARRISVTNGVLDG